jgi:hypothetical protein
MPDGVNPPSGHPSETCPDLIVRVDGLSVAIEVYGPIDLFGFQVIQTYVIKILKYLEIDRGYALRVQIEPGAEHDLWYGYQFEPEIEIRPWLSKFAQAATTWLSCPSPQPVFRQNGPSTPGWKLSVAIEELYHERTSRMIHQSSATRSDDPRLHFEVGTAHTTADGWWGRSVRNKMAKRQAGPAPIAGLLRLLVVDFARLDTAFPDFICWPRIAERIDASVRLLASQIGGELPYDVILPARLGLSCCFGSPVWLGETKTRMQQDLLNLAGLTIPCNTPTEVSVDWPFVSPK